METKELRRQLDTLTETAKEAEASALAEALAVTEVELKPKKVEQAEQA